MMRERVSGFKLFEKKLTGEKQEKAVLSNLLLINNLLDSVFFESNVLSSRLLVVHFRLRALFGASQRLIYRHTDRSD